MRPWQVIFGIHDQMTHWARHLVLSSGTSDAKQQGPGRTSASRAIALTEG
jgi:hypothetical protein